MTPINILPVYFVTFGGAFHNELPRRAVLGGDVQPGVSGERGGIVFAENEKEEGLGGSSDEEAEE